MAQRIKLVARGIRMDEPISSEFLEARLNGVDLHDEEEAAMDRVRQQMWSDMESGTFSLDDIS